MPVRLAVTAGTVADCSRALPVIEGIEAECLLADKAYDTNEIIAAVRQLGMGPVIPPKSNRREKRDYDRALYKLRHLVENGFLEFKQWRGGSDPLCQENGVILGHLPTPGSDGLEQTLLTTPPSSRTSAVGALAHLCGIGCKCPVFGGPWPVPGSKWEDSNGP